MPQFEMETILPVSTQTLSMDLLNMSGVNSELAPFFKMSAPVTWYSKPITEWPVNTSLFSSKILLMGIIPIDWHRFKFDSVGEMGFKETSSTLINKQWRHERSITSNGTDSIVKDIVHYKSKLGYVGYVLKPFYKAIFKHRHARLKLKYVS